MSKRFQRIVSLAVAVMLTTVGIASQAEGYRTSAGNFFVGGHTTNDGQIRDPINLLLNGGNRTIPGVDMIESWNGQATGGHAMEHRRWHHIDCLSSQSLRFFRPSVDDGDDRQFATKKCAADRWHARVWDSVEHDDAHEGSGHPRDRFAPGGVHKDNYKNGSDVITSPWELAEKYMGKELGDADCSWHDLRALPGSAGEFQWQDSNGYYSRISPQRIGDGQWRHLRSSGEFRRDEADDHRRQDDHPEWSDVGRCLRDRG